MFGEAKGVIIRTVLVCINDLTPRCLRLHGPFSKSEFCADVFMCGRISPHDQKPAAASTANFRARGSGIEDTVNTAVYVFVGDIRGEEALVFSSLLNDFSGIVLSPIKLQRLIHPDGVFPHCL